MGDISLRYHRNSHTDITDELLSGLIASCTLCSMKSKNSSNLESSLTANNAFDTVSIRREHESFIQVIHTFPIITKAKFSVSNTKAVIS